VFRAENFIWRGTLFIEAAVIILSCTVGKKCMTVKKQREGMPASSGPHWVFFGLVIWPSDKRSLNSIGGSAAAKSLGDSLAE
jgi:hypothetical protein